VLTSSYVSQYRSGDWEASAAVTGFIEGCAKCTAVDEILQPDNVVLAPQSNRFIITSNLSFSSDPFCYWHVRGSVWLGGAVVRALDLRLEVADLIPAAALSSATLDNLFTHIAQRLWCCNFMAFKF